jgi:hypothetical protein
MDNSKTIDSITTDDNNSIVSPPIEWTVEHEKILIEWADKAMCYRWLHAKSTELFSSLNAWYTIPVIIISTLTGTANFAQERIPVEYQSFYVMGVGAFNILAGIITTIQQFLKITQLNEAHRVSSISWDKFYRNIKVELAKHPRERMDVRHMLKLSKEEFDRLMETSPAIPPKIIQRFRGFFPSIEGYEKIIKPEICDVLIPTNEYRNPWYNAENQQKEMDIKKQLLAEKQKNIKKLDNQNIKTVKDFIILFKNLNNREPMEIEIIDNLKDKLSVDIIKKVLDENVIISLKNDSFDNDGDMV